MITYGIYLIHPFYLYTFKEKIYVFETHLLNQILVVSLTYGTAYILYIGFERPMLIVRDRLTKSQAKLSKYSIN